MDAHAGKWTHWSAWARTPAKGHAVAGKGFKAETPTMNWSEQEALDDDSRQRDEEWCLMDVHAGEWTRYERTDGRTDGQMTCNLIIALCVASCGKNLASV